MSRRHLTLALAAVASLVVTACSSNPMAPQAQRGTTTSVHADGLTSTDTTARSGWIGSGG